MSDAKPVKKAAKPKKPAEHPKCSVMIAAAITALKDRKGSSLAAIKKYIGANYKVDLVKLGPHLKLAVKKGIEKSDRKEYQVGNNNIQPNVFSDPTTTLTMGQTPFKKKQKEEKKY